MTSTDIDGRAVVAVAGEIDVSTAPALREKLAVLVENGRTDLIVDLTAVRFMDSTALGVLVGVLKRVRGAGGDLRLVVSSDRLLTVFRITALHQVFSIHATVAEALADPSGR